MGLHVPYMAFIAKSTRQVGYIKRWGSPEIIREFFVDPSTMWKENFLGLCLARVEDDRTSVSICSAFDVDITSKVTEISINLIPVLSLYLLHQVLENHNHHIHAQTVNCSPLLTLATSITRHEDMIKLLKLNEAMFGYQLAMKSHMVLGSIKPSFSTLHAMTSVHSKANST
ncbi:hypothetical protein VNO77_22323 [Canavalia gladiata]|uniref:Uncharacterized protein n=1 Tax=Canavalia gladiata TaxID=3824 RepID=A0AAN9QAF9_CANGL